MNRRIDCPKGVIRPAMDRMRESVFAILGNLSGHRFLDLFAGSGIIAIEAASRGAGPVVLVERDHKKRNIIKKNLEIITEKWELQMMTAEKYLKTAEEPFTTIFLDPPFSYPKKEKLIGLIGERELLTSSGTVLLHHPLEDPIPASIGGFEQYRENKYGRSIVKFYRSMISNQRLHRSGKEESGNFMGC